MLGLGITGADDLEVVALKLWRSALPTDADDSRDPKLL